MWHRSAGDEREPTLTSAREQESGRRLHHGNNEEVSLLNLLHLNESVLLELMANSTERLLIVNKMHLAPY